MNLEDGEKLKEWRKVNGLSQRELANILGRSQGFIGNIESGSSGLSRDMIARMAERTNINIMWLLTGEGPVNALVEDKGFSGRLPETHISPVDPTLPARGDFAVGKETYSLVKKFEVNVSAGPGLYPVEEDTQDNIAISDTWLLKNRINGDLCGLVRVSGDSMAPTIPNGSLALVHMPEMYLEQEGIYAFSRDGKAYIKRLSPIRIPDGNQLVAIVITSDNPAYPQETVTGEEINNIRVVGRVRKCLVDL